MEQHSFGNATACSECGKWFTVLYGPRRICQECLNKQGEAFAPYDAEPAEEGKEGIKAKAPDRWRNMPIVPDIDESDTPGIEPGTEGAEPGSLSVEAIAGVGVAYAGRLREARIQTVAELAALGDEQVAIVSGQVGQSHETVHEWREAAREMLGEPEVGRWSWDEPQFEELGE